VTCAGTGCDGCRAARDHYREHGCLREGCTSTHDAPPPMPAREAVRRRTLREWLRGEHPLPDGCVVREGVTCPHGWTVRAL
jgi:hypothetical protein